MDRIVATSLLTLVLLVAAAAPTRSDSAPDTGPAAAARQAIAALPEHLRDTGLFVDGSTSEVRADNLPFAPQYPLWSDGATKRRWLHLPPGTAIDASLPDAWEFPRGTKLWKEFGHAGRPVETRLIERLADGSWRFASYVWNADGTDALLAPAQGVPALALAAAPGGRYAIPSRTDCLACHEGSAVPVLGASALQLSPARDAQALHGAAPEPHNIDLAALIARGRLVNLPTALIEAPPRIAAATPTARAALGYLHGNCGHCHNAEGPLAGLDLQLAQQTGDPVRSAARTVRTLVGASSRFRPPGTRGDAQRIAPGHEGTSVLAQRMRSNNPIARMPPLGVQVIDEEAVSLIERWIRHDLVSQAPTKE